MALVERFHVNGEPRDAELADLNGDGWNDAVIVIRDADKIQAYANIQGELVLSSEAPVGKKPCANWRWLISIMTGARTLSSSIATATTSPFCSVAAATLSVFNNWIKAIPWMAKSPVCLSST